MNLAMYSFHLQQNPLLFGIILVIGAIFVGIVLHEMIFRFVLRRSAANTQTQRHVLLRFRKPALWLFLTCGVMLTSGYLPIPPWLHPWLRHGLGLLFIAEMAWAAVAILGVLEDLLIRRYDSTEADNIQVRRIRTQVLVIRRLAIGMIVIVAIGMMLYSFDNKLAKYGAGLLASAGIASLALAAAAKSSVSNVLAGLQIAISEPIRLEDVVIIDNEWGWIEEINTTYVVVRIWDWRRLIVPLSYFIENPFQNWTRQSAALMGTCYIYTDYTVQVEPLREQLQKVLESTPLWDTSKKVCVLQVTELNQHCMQLRCLMSARSSGDLWDLRCYVRERMIAFLQETYPESLPMQRLGELTVKNVGVSATKPAESFSAPFHDSDPMRAAGV